MYPRIRNVCRTVCLVLTVGLSLFHLAAVGVARNIRLRNELIDPDSGTNRAVLAAALRARTAATGLYLIQFDGPLASDRRADLRAAGVELLQYVPADAFVAKLNNVSPAGIAGLGYVRWLGPYRPEHKIHPRLAAAAPLAAQTNGTLDLSLLLSATATPAEIAEVRTHLAVVDQESHLRLGTILRGQIVARPPGRAGPIGGGALAGTRAPRKLVDEAASKLVGGDDGNVATPTITQQLGFNGAGVTVCVADTGLDTGNTNTMHPDLLGRVTGFHFYGDLTDGSDGYGHGTHCAGHCGRQRGDGRDGPGHRRLVRSRASHPARICSLNAFLTPMRTRSVRSPSDDTLTQDAVRNGAKIGSNSWGNDVQGEYDMDAAQFDELVRDADPGTPGDQPYILEFSAGNAGPDTQTMDSPASGKNVIATGASENVTGTLAETYGLVCRRTGHDVRFLQPRAVRGRAHQAGPGRARKLDRLRRVVRRAGRGRHRLGHD